MFLWRAVLELWVVPLGDLDASLVGWTIGIHIFAKLISTLFLRRDFLALTESQLMS